MIELYHSQRAMRARRSAALQRGVIAVLDVDHDKYKFFDSTDKKYLKKIINKLEQTLD